MSVASQAGSHYQNLLEGCSFEPGKPVISPVSAIGDTQVKRVLLQAGTELRCHKTEDRVLVLWLQGKARFQANDDEYIMQPGSMLEMPSGTPHGAHAETNCVFAVLKFKTT